MKRRIIACLGLSAIVVLAVVLMGIYQPVSMPLKEVATINSPFEKVKSLNYIGGGLFSISCDSEEYAYALYDSNGNSIGNAIYTDAPILYEEREFIPVATEQHKMSANVIASTSMLTGLTPRSYSPDHYGFIDIEGNEIVPCEYDEVGEFRDGLAPIRKDGEWGFVDSSGIIKIDFQYDNARDFSKGLACVEKGGISGNYGYINTKGEEVIPFEYYIAGNFNDGLAYVKQSKYGKYGYINIKGEVVIPFEYDDANTFREGFAWVEKDGKRFFINKEGKPIEIQDVVISSEYDTYGFSENVAVLRRDGQYGAVNKKGKWVIPCEYDEIGNFTKEGLAVAKKDGKRGYINSKGKTVIPFEYDYAKSFRDGYAVVKRDGKYGIINKKGKPVIPCDYEMVEIGDEVFCLLKNGKISFISH